jgi:hypothetical protein
MVSPGAGGKTFSRNALRPNRKYMRESGSESRNERNRSRYVTNLFPFYDGSLGWPLISPRCKKNKHSFGLTENMASVNSSTDELKGCLNDFYRKEDPDGKEKSIQEGTPEGA